MKNLITIAAGSLLILASCRTPRYVYAPSPPNNPFFKAKGDSKISAYYSGGGSDGNISGEQNRGLDLQAAYALTDHFAITFDHFFRKERDIYEYYQANDFDSSVVNYHRNITSIGAGYFFAMNRRKKITFNLYGGVGFGKSKINDHGIDNSNARYTRYHNANATKWYLQPGFNFMPGKVFWCSITTRFVLLKYGGINTSYTPTELEDFDLSNLGSHTLFFFEPAYTMQFGVPHCPWLKIAGGFALSANLTSVRENNYNHYDHYAARSVTGFLGLNFDFSKINKK